MLRKKRTLENATDAVKFSIVEYVPKDGLAIGLASKELNRFYNAMPRKDVVLFKQKQKDALKNYIEKVQASFPILTRHYQRLPSAIWSQVDALPASLRSRFAHCKSITQIHQATEGTCRTFFQSLACPTSPVGQELGYCAGGLAGAAMCGGLSTILIGFPLVIFKGLSCLAPGWTCGIGSALGCLPAGIDFSRDGYKVSKQQFAAYQFEMRSLAKKCQRFADISISYHKAQRFLLFIEKKSGSESKPVEAFKPSPTLGFNNK